MNPMLYVGTAKESVIAAKQAIIEIIKQPNVDSDVKIKALDVLEKLCAINDLTVSHCVFNNGKGK